MNRWIINITMVLLLLLGGLSMAHAADTNSPPKPEGRMKPPPEAFAACKGQSEGTAVQFTTPRGDTLKGVCRTLEGVLVAMPDRKGPPPGKPPADAGGVPPAAQ